MHPSEQKAFRNSLDAIRSALDLLRQRIEERNRANAHYREAEHNDQKSIASAIVSIKVSDSERIETNRTQESRHRENLGEQKILRNWTAAAFCAAAIYAGIAICQWRTMNETYTEIKAQTKAAQCTAKAAQKQAELMRQQLVGTEAAVLQNIGVDWTPMGVSVTVNAVGRTGLTPERVTVVYQLTRYTFPKMKKIGQTIDYSETIHHNPSLVKTFPIKLPNVELKDQQDTVTVVGTVDWDDGFGTRTITPFCRTYLGLFNVKGVTPGFPPRGEISHWPGGGFYNCDQIEPMVKYLFSHREDWVPPS